MDKILSFERKYEDDYYAIIGCDELSSTEQIHAEYKVKALECHPDKHPDDKNAVEKFAKLQRAKEVLCTPELRAKYDTWKLSGICISYADWCTKKESVKMSMHWASKVKKEPMLEEGPSTKDKVDSGAQPLANNTPQKNSQGFESVGWKREQNDMIRKFRTYQI